MTYAEPWLLLRGVRWRERKGPTAELSLRRGLTPVTPPSRRSYLESSAKMPDIGVVSGKVPVLSPKLFMSSSPSM